MMCFPIITEMVSLEIGMVELFPMWKKIMYFSACFVKNYNRIQNKGWFFFSIKKLGKTIVGKVGKTMRNVNIFSFICNRHSLLFWRQYLV